MWVRVPPPAPSLLLTYGVGHCAVIVAASASTEWVERFLKWNQQSKGVAVIKYVCGAVLVILDPVGGSVSFYDTHVRLEKV